MAREDLLHACGRTLDRHTLQEPARARAAIVVSDEDSRDRHEHAGHVDAQLVAHAALEAAVGERYASARLDKILQVFFFVVVVMSTWRGSSLTLAWRGARFPCWWSEELDEDVGVGAGAHLVARLYVERVGYGRVGVNERAARATTIVLVALRCRGGVQHTRGQTVALVGG